MRRALAVALAAVLVLTGVGGAALADAPTPSSASVGPSDAAETAAASTDDPEYMAGQDRYRRLELSGESRSGTVGSGWNLGARIDASDDVLRNVYDSRQFQTRLERSGLTGERREQAVSERLQAVESRTEAMREAERRVVRAYAAGDASLSNLTRVLVANDAEARALRAVARDLEDISESTSNENYARALQLRLSTFYSPLRQRLASSLRNGGDVRVSVRATGTGYVLGAIDGETYYREALRYDNRRPDGPKSITSNPELGDRQTEVYDISPSGRQQYYQGAGAYIGRMVYRYPDTEIRAFFDGGTGDVFFERSRHVLEDMQRTTAVNETNGTLQLRVERTFYNGPVRIVVTDEDGDPVDAVVRVGGERLGRTGEDGALWVVEPAISYAVSATANGTTVSGSVIFS
jgi:hypothetical protein